MSSVDSGSRPSQTSSIGGNESNKESSDAGCEFAATEFWWRATSSNHLSLDEDAEPAVGPIDEDIASKAQGLLVDEDGVSHKVVTADTAVVELDVGSSAGAQRSNFGFLNFFASFGLLFASDTVYRRFD